MRNSAFWFIVNKAVERLVFKEAFIHPAMTYLCKILSVVIERDGILLEVIYEGVEVIGYGNFLFFFGNLLVNVVHGIFILLSIALSICDFIMASCI